MTGGAIAAEPAKRPARFADVLRVRAFAVLYAAETQSIAGDQLARVALSVLVFRRTGSATATALTYAATYLPAILGGVLLAGFGDRLPRRLVMIGCDLARAALFAVMAVSGLPTAAVVALLVVAVFLRPAFSASAVSYLAASLEPELFRAGNGLRMIGNQIAQVAGFAIGGVLVAAVSPRGALLINAGTYVLSAVLVAALLRPVRASDPAGDPARGPRRLPTVASGRDVWQALWGDRQLRALLALSALAGLFVVAEGLAVPFAAGSGASTAEIGVLLAAIPLGSAAGIPLLVRAVRVSRRGFAASWMAVGCGIPLAVTALIPHWQAALGLWFVSGALAAYQVEIMTAIVQRTPDRLRARVVGLCSSVLVGAQGLGLAVFGAVANAWTPARSIGLAGLVGAVLACVLVVGPLRRWTQPPDAPRDGFGDVRQFDGAVGPLGAPEAAAMPRLSG
jgi:predicted MFS family arabinose efflux permease